MKKCAVCKEKFTPKYSSLQKVCINPKCILEWCRIEGERKADEKWKKKKEQLRTETKSRSEYEKDLQIVINELVREIDRGYPCIATGSHHGKKNSGHYYSVGSNPTLRFHLENIWIQSEHSNNWKAGDTVRYRAGIISTFGQDYMDYMDSLQQTKPIKLSIEEIKEKIVIVRRIIKELKRTENKFTNEQRVQLRKDYNKEIGIYN